jgi:hypothetical protein
VPLTSSDLEPVIPSEIINRFKTLFSNGPVEGTNNKIKVIKRTAYGFRNFENFRLRILVSLKNSYLSLNYHYHIKKLSILKNG